MSSVEKSQARRISATNGAIKSAQRVFIVTIADSSVNPILDVQLPAYNEPYPNGGTGLFAIKKSVSANLNETTFEVTIDYGPLSFGNIPAPPPNQNDLGFKTIQDSFTLVEITLPMLNQKQIIYFQPTPGSPTVPQAVPRWIWVRDDRKISIAHEVVQIRLKIANYTSTERNIIEQQTNKFHNLASGATNIYKFLGADVNQIGENLWDITYSWTYDPGNAGIDNKIATAFDANGNPTAFATRNDLVTSPARPAFYSYIVFPALGFTQTDKPTINIIASYNVTDVKGYAGAHGLPGAPV